MTSQAPRTQCVRCVFRLEDDPSLDLDSEGTCRHCRGYEARRAAAPSRAERERRFKDLIVEIRERGRGRAYDCVVGLSGGVDSSYVAYLAHRHDLRTLVVHLDNGWNTETAVSNIENALRRTGFDLFTYVINWPEFRDLQMAYLKAGVIDIEALTDHAIRALLYRAARRFNVPHILTGVNWATEGVLPEAWVHMKEDAPNIRAIHRRFGTRPLRTFPLMGLPQLWLNRVFWRIRESSILDLVEYDRSAVKKRLREDFGWRDYGGKHHESVFTRFYQTYILPQKFAVDKRRSHLSTLVCAGQMTREDALLELQDPPLDPDLAAIDKEFAARKFGVSPEELDRWMAAPARAHLDFASYRHVLGRLSSVKRFLLGRRP